ncbi:MAG: hypothetical protein ACK5S2_04015 [Lysobacteraceae bacterium]|nr:hypothetical protein [Silanimonas sp.]
MKVKLVVEDESRVAEWEIGHSLLAGLIGYDFPMPPSDHPLVDLLSRHPSSAVRRQVAESFELPEDVLKRLESDPIISVREGLVSGHSTTKERLSHVFLMRIIQESIEAADRVIFDLSEFGEADMAEITKALISHSDPAVRKRAAENDVGSKAGKKKLKADDDVEVRKAANDR